MLGEGGLWKISESRGYQMEGEVADSEGRGTYYRIRVEGGTELTPPD